jgi:hypothetical protein
VTGPSTKGNSGLSELGVGRRLLGLPTRLQFAEPTVRICDLIETVPGTRLRRKRCQSGPKVFALLRLQGPGTPLLPCGGVFLWALALTRPRDASSRYSRLSWERKRAMDEATQAVLTRTLTYQANFVSMSIHALVKCLTENGALRPGQGEAVMRATIDNAGSATSQLDYVLLRELVDRLEGREPTAH